MYMVCESLIASDTPIVLRMTPVVQLMVGITTQNSVMSVFVSKLSFWFPTLGSMIFHNQTHLDNNFD
jgi:ATP/ADP translocase